MIRASTCTAASRQMRRFAGGNQTTVRIEIELLINQVFFPHPFSQMNQRENIIFKSAFWSTPAGPAGEVTGLTPSPRPRALNCTCDIHVSTKQMESEDVEVFASKHRRSVGTAPACLVFPRTRLGRSSRVPPHEARPLVSPSQLCLLRAVKRRRRG
ncbi:hypothetical protein CesoFtcFv8_017951 [Champsocephalus esox]|uniref:Uncharacterized protein n=1 Tax=Champsocephalus esox TaxID=159716 RepID=A0AAN8GSC0_9TELE|nr:hypothetical protein CesoFtcFv8_017951 [Champsocephalus esox]